MRCPSCNSDNPENTKFCGSCGRPRTKRCDKCGAENPPQFKFCGECGAALAGDGTSAAANLLQATSTTFEIRVTPAEPDPSITIEGERKTVMVLFADINGSTELMEDLDPEEARAIIDAQADDRCGPSLRWLRRAIHWRWDLRAFLARRLRLVTFILGASSPLSSMVEATIVGHRVRFIERAVVRPIRIQLRLKNRLLLLHHPASLTGPGAVVSVKPNGLDAPDSENASPLSSDREALRSDAGNRLAGSFLGEESYRTWPAALAARPGSAVHPARWKMMTASSRSGLGAARPTAEQPACMDHFEPLDMELRK